MPGRVRADVGGTQHGAVLVEQAQAGADRGAGAAGLPASSRASASAYQPRARSMAGPAAPGRAASRRCAAALGARCRAGAAGSPRGCGRRARAPASARRRSVVGTVDGRADVVGARAHPSVHRARSTARRASAAHSGRCWRSNSRAARRACGSAAAGSSSSRAASARTSRACGSFMPRRAAGVLRDGLLRRLPGLADQPHRQQQLAAVDQQLPEPAACSRMRRSADGRVREGGGGLAAQPQHPRRGWPGRTRPPAAAPGPRPAARPGAGRPPRRRTRAG